MYIKNCTFIENANENSSKINDELIGQLLKMNKIGVLSNEVY